LSRGIYDKAVLDASVLLQTVVREKYSEKAIALLKMLKEIIAPSILLYEVGNALMILSRRGFISKEEAVRKFNRITSVPTLRITDVTFDKAINLATELNITLYDASYLSLAVEAKTALITADRNLYESGRSAANVIHISEVG